MHLTRAEREGTIILGAAAAVLLPVSLIVLRLARGYSVPSSLIDMTGRGWESIALGPSPVHDKQR
jgi:hypothetical protein